MNKVRIYEVGPRDGLQNESKMIASADKIKLIDMLSDCGFEKIEATSFVSPKWVPQMADAADVMAGISRKSGVDYAVLTPNMKGLEAALSAGVDEVAIFGSASEGFSQKNINASIAESLERFKPVAHAALNAGVKLRGYLSCVIECPYDGPTPPEAVGHWAEELLALGCYEISLGDTIGKGTPDTVAPMLDAVCKSIAPSKLAGHFHDTNGNALQNIGVSLDYDVRVFDASVGGLGGCPYAPGAKGNVATESVVPFVEARRLETGIDLEKLQQVAGFARTLRGV